MQTSSHGSSDKIFGDNHEEPFGDNYGYDEFEDNGDTWSTNADEQATIDEFLSLDLGEEEYGDLTDGETLVAGPASSVQVVFS